VAWGRITATFRRAEAQKPWIHLEDFVPDAGVNQPYKAYLTLGASSPMDIGVGASSPMQIHYEVIEGILPLGIELNDGILSGVPTTAGHYTFMVKVSNPTTDAQSSAVFNINLSKSEHNSDGCRLQPHPWIDVATLIQRAVLELDGVLRATMQTGEAHRASALPERSIETVCASRSGNVTSASNSPLPFRW
jgi:hypothetical protein